jgi:flagellum-specific peptidoglycan hydrolase FlgJ
VSDFFSTYAKYAQQAGKALDIPASVILGQWALESDYGQSSLAKRSGNLAGIKFVAGKSIASGATGAYADYNNDSAKFAQDYSRVMKLSYYNAVRDAVSVEDTVKALAASPYAESHYGGSGASIMSIIKQYGLTKYDTQDIIGNDSMIKNFSVEVPKDAKQKTIALAIIGVGLAMLGALISD